MRGERRRRRGRGSAVAVVHRWVHDDVTWHVGEAFAWVGVPGGKGHEGVS
jgi:hypothetical protein